MSETSKLRFVVLVAVILLLGSTAAAGAAGGRVIKSTAQTQSGTIGLVIPLYTYPGSTWTTVIQEKTAYPNVPFIAVINPNSGPGSYQDSNYVTGIQQMQSAGITVLGYVDTAYAADSISSVESNVNLYNSWYHVNGIMFDDMSNLVTDESYYSTLNSYVHSIGMQVTMGNPGATVPTGEVGVFNILDIYENTGLPNLSSLYYGSVPTSEFSLIVISTSLNMSFLSSAQSYVGYIYLTDSGLPNPYDTLPSYFASEVADLAILDTATTTTTSSSDPAIISVNSSSMSGQPIDGMWTTVQSGGGIVASGYTPFSFEGTANTQYTVAVASYGSIVFCKWQDGNTNSSQTITLNGSTSLSAYYSTTGSCPNLTVSLTVDSSLLNGSTVSGLWSTVSSGGTIIGSGYTPYSLSVNTGQQFTVTVSNYGIYTFNQWSTGSTSNTITITPTSSTTVVAYYTTPVTITIQSSFTNGRSLPGMWAVVKSGGSVIMSGYTPLSLTVNSGNQYTITVSNYGKYSFSHWNTGSTSPTIVITPSQNTELVAYYDH